MEQNYTPNLLSHLKGHILTENTISNQNINTQYNSRKERDISLKLIGKESHLDYTFLSHRNTFNTEAKNKTNAKAYLYDLLKTFDINLEILHQKIKSWKVEDEKEELIKLFNQITKSLKKKNEKRKIFEGKLGKSLIDKQIILEITKKIEETSEYYREQMKDNEENIDGKDEYKKVFEGKLIEVEIYIQKATKTITHNSIYNKYKGWKMNEFLIESHKINSERDLLKKELDKIMGNIDELRDENLFYRDTNKDDNIKIDNNNNEKMKKLRGLTKFYRNQIEMLEVRLHSYKTCFNNIFPSLLSSKEKETEDHKNNQNIIEDEDKDKDKDINNETVNKSIIPADLNKKINNFMDFSTILNKRGEETKNDFGKSEIGGFGNITNLNMWDISHINKK